MQFVYREYGFESLSLSHRKIDSAGGVFRSQLPMLIAMILFSVMSLWLLKQPMEMRTSAM